MWVFDPKTMRILGVNRNATLHYRCRREEFLRMTLRDLRPPEDVPVLDHIMAEVATDAPPRTDLVRHRKKDGSVIDVEVTGQHVRFLEHSARIVVVNDVTERRQLEQQLQQAQKIEAVGQLAGGIAHDFNNILTVINNSAELAIDDLAPWHPVLEHLRAISDAGKRAAALTTQLLAFSRQQPRQAQVLTLPHVVKGVEPMLRRLLGENISISVHHDQSPAIVGDRAQLEQVLMNLAVNARDAMPRGGQLTIETGRVEFGADTIPPSGVAPGRYAQLSVTDNGCGMDAWTRARVFEPFFTTKEPGKGTGLGLSTVYGIVKQNGGGLSLYSEPNQGSTFRVYLPEAAAEAEGGEIRAAEAAPAGRRSGGCETVLLVEDEPQVRVLAQRILQQAGYTVLAADGANQELALAEGASRIDLLVTDVVMPDMSGRELAERLAALRPDLNVLYMSGYTADAVVHHGILDPGIAFMSKPFSGGELRRQVRDVLDRRTGAGG
jgi:PAS domain S-box-containing protein